MPNDSVQLQFEAALDRLVEQVKLDRSVLAALLCGSLSHDRVWAKSDIDLVLVTVDDKKVDQSELSLNADGVNVHTNTAESFFALLKRGHYGVFHQLSKKHLHRYCDEFSFRWDHRRVTDGERMTAAIKGVKGKRLMYRCPDKEAS